MEWKRRPDWSKWRLMPEISLFEAVALSLDSNPDTVRRRNPTGGLHSSNLAVPYEFTTRAEIVERVANASEPDRSGLILQTYAGLASKVRPANFVRWAQLNEWTMPPELLAIAEKEHASEPLQSQRWPWGDYDTRLLRILDATARKWWENYDPSDGTTAPRLKEDIEPWLKKNFPPISGKEIAAIDKILRAEGIKKGPRGYPQT